MRRPYRSRLPRSGRGAPRRRGADRADRGRRRRLGRAQAWRRPAGTRRRASRRSAVKVAVTGTDKRLAERLRAAGFDVIEAPLIRIEEIDGPPIEAEGYD